MSMTHTFTIIAMNCVQEQLNTVFSHFEIGVKMNHVTKPLAFSLHFLFRRDQNRYSNLT